MDFYILPVFIGFILGGVIVAFGSLYKSKNIQNNNHEELDKNYVKKELYTDLQKRLDEIQNKFDIKNKELLELSIKNAQAEQINKDLQKNLDEKIKDFTQIQEKLKIDFKNLANEILEEKGKKMVELNSDKLGNILNPLNKEIKEFKDKVEGYYRQEGNEKSILREQIINLSKLNQQLSDDAKNLTKALKGDSKVQGNWGEIQLELLLEKAGLEKDIHYRKQESIRAEDGSLQRPDYIINLPDGKNLIIDSKVSLSAYEMLFNESDDNQKDSLLKNHLISVNKHIVELGDKKYQDLYAVNQPDYVCMFVPIESALMIALKEDLNLFEKALSKNVILLSNSTLMAILRTIAYVWRQENQRKNIDEIARQSGALYDKFVLFSEDLIKIGRQIDSAKDSHTEAMKKLTTSDRKGDSIVGKIENIKKLGAPAKKSIPQILLDKVEEVAILAEV